MITCVNPRQGSLHPVLWSSGTSANGEAMVLVGDEGERETASLYVCTCAPTSTPVGGRGGETGSQVAEEGGLSVAESCA